MSAICDLHRQYSYSIVNMDYITVYITEGSEFCGSEPSSVLLCFSRWRGERLGQWQRLHGGLRHRVWLCQHRGARGGGGPQRPHRRLRHAPRPLASPVGYARPGSPGTAPALEIMLGGPAPTWTAGLLSPRWVFLYSDWGCGQVSV